ncbi:MAG: hypothetical protein COA79_14690 [Planctomycetota bacterium]|nr:MAG: hypothetical protein COA79_14690 [Planctomycetota bacterium]
MDIYENLKNLKINLPTPVSSVANYLPYTIHQNTIYISGQLPIKNGDVLHQGQVGQNISIDEAIEAAQICCINIIAQLNEATDKDLNKVKRCLKLGIFVACTSDFTDQPKVGNGASDLIVNIFGDIGKHSRFSVGCTSLPLNACVEIDAIFAI